MRGPNSVLFLIGLCLAALATPAAATPADGETLAAGTVMEAVARLKPGQFLWAPQVAPSGPLLLVVNLATQRAVLYRNGVPVGITTVSTGRAGHLTPLGSFTILEKQVVHYSSIYDNAPMPFMERLTWGGVALHGGTLPGYPASHGCIRLPLDFARLLFAETRLGTTVMVVRSDLSQVFSPAIDPLPTDTFPGLSFAWAPERAPSGPISLVLSTADHRLVVLRDGREIGTVRADIDRPADRPQLFILQSGAPDVQSWTPVALPGQDVAGTPAVRLEDLHLDESFRALLAAAVEPGATLVVTGDSFVPTADGSRVAVEAR